MSLKVKNEGQDSNGVLRVPRLDTSGNTLVSLATQIAGEDITNDVMKVEFRNTYAVISTAVGTAVKATSGNLHYITVNNAGTAWEIDVYDGVNTTAGTRMGTIRGASTGNFFPYDTAFGTGLYIDTVKGTTPGNITVSYR